MADALGSVIVIISAVIMWQTEWKYKYYVDPGLSILLVILILKSVWPLLIESALILLQTVPTHIQVFFNGRECFVNRVKLQTFIEAPEIPNVKEFPKISIPFQQV